MPEEGLIENMRTAEIVGYLFLIVASRIDAKMRIERPEIAVAANVIPVRMSNENGR